MSTRLIGGIIMVHGDDNGLVLPPRIAPVQVMIVPIQQAKEGVLEKAAEIKSVLSGYRVKVDDTDKSPDGNLQSPRCAAYRFAWRSARRILRQARPFWYAAIPMRRYPFP